MALVKYVEKDSGKEVKKVPAFPITKVIGGVLAIPFVIFELAVLASGIGVTGKLVWTGIFAFVWLLVVTISLLIEADAKGYW